MYSTFSTRFRIYICFIPHFEYILTQIGGLSTYDYYIMDFRVDSTDRFLDSPDLLQMKWKNF